tara:strand:- start:1013 stop:1507 length:495 start_codon:yes stop_codon:yes gene_type:complete
VPVATVGRPVGLNGGFRILLLCDIPALLKPGCNLYAGTNPSPYQIKSFTSAPKTSLTLLDVTSRAQAKSLTGKTLYRLYEEALPLLGDRYFISDIIGLEAKTKSGEILGTICEVIETGANDVWVVKTGSEEILLPVISEVITSVNFEDGFVLVNIIPGLLGDQQ